VASVDHFEFRHDGNGLTCNPETITIKACADLACTQLVTDQVTVNLSPVTPTGQEGWSGTGVVGDQLTFTGGTASINLSSTSPGVVTLGVTDTTPSATLCVVNSSTASAANCALMYADSGFIFGSSASPTSGIADEFANKPNSIIVSAVQTDAISNKCVPKFANQSQSLGFWQSYSAPNTGTKSITVTSGSTNINAGADFANKVPLALTFNNQGQATIAVNYADAGQVTLHANYTGSAATLDAGLVMNGADSFVRYPKALCVRPETTCAAGNDSCPAFKRAGEDFTVEIEPKAWQSDTDSDFCDNISTPNYAHDNIELSVNLVAPSALSGGVNADDIADYSHSVPNPITTTGINTVTRAISEVGVFSITADPPDQYLGSSRPIVSGTSQAIGRFYPNDFAVSAASIADSCAGSGAFTYMDQPVPLAMTITARNTSGATTKNYFSGFASGVATLVAENNNDGGNSSYQSRFLPAIGLSWDQADQGVQTVNQNLTFKRQLGSADPNVINTLDGPFTLMQVGLIITDNDNVTVESADMNAGFATDCSVANNCNAKQLDVKNYRYGRINLANTFGAETTELLMPVTAQYWNDTINDWVVNTDDNSCSSFTNATLPSSGVNFSPALTGSQSVTRATNSTNFVLGKAELQWNAISASPARYRGEVNAPLAVDSWLQWFWDGSDLSDLSDPSASAFFGTFRGQDRIISWREVN
jgi:MSHA biogenesis protein MshQ